MSAPTALGTCRVSPVVIEVLGADDTGWLVRSRHLDGPPVKCWGFPTRECANSFAAALHELSAPVLALLIGIPSVLRLGETSDAT